MDSAKKVNTRSAAQKLAKKAGNGAKKIQKGAKSFILAHISAENNDPNIALDEFLSAVADPTVKVAAAHPEFVTEIV